MQANLSWLCFFSLALLRGVQPNPKHDQPKQPARTQTDNRPNWPLRRSVTGFCSQDLTPAGRVAGFLLQNPSHPTRPTLYKSDNIQGDPSEIWWDPTTYEEIQVRSRPYLVRSGKIRGDPGWYWRFLVQIYWVFVDSSEFFEDFGYDLVYFCSDLVSFAKIRWRFDVLLLRSSDFCTNPAKIRWKI